ncbi:hypothetical protein [Amorphus sp. 3PC139-8]|uniref:hypothetical protein n=1 Tax=Amorphus sp. 3PC139-8 TaxID=2735676 RepID=UPI00345DCC94
MQTRVQIAALVSMMANAVVFGFGAIAVLSVPALAVHASVLLPLIIAVSFAVTPVIGWVLAPRLRARNWLNGDYKPAPVHVRSYRRRD